MVDAVRKWFADRLDKEYGYDRGCKAYGHDERWCAYCEAYADGAEAALEPMLPLIEACLMPHTTDYDEYARDEAIEAALRDLGVPDA